MSKLIPDDSCVRWVLALVQFLCKCEDFLESEPPLKVPKFMGVTFPIGLWWDDWRYCDVKHHRFTNV